MPMLCGVCNKEPFRYTCPKCQILFCSLPCYQSHGEKCTEGFYKAQVETELHNYKVSDGERRRLERIVAQLNCLDASDEDGDDEDSDQDGDPESERLGQLAALAASGDLQLEDLSEQEVRCFHSELKRGVLGQALDVWEPWWERAPVEVSKDGLRDDVSLHVCCSHGRIASPSVALTVLEAVYAYCHLMRAFNGDWVWEPAQAAAHFLLLAPAICKHQVHVKASLCLQSSLEAAAAMPGGGFGPTLASGCIADSATILATGPMFTMRAMREALELVEAAAGAAREAAKDKSASRLGRGVKKLEFLLSFACHHGDAIVALSPEVHAFAKTRASEAEAAKHTENRLAHDGIALPSMLDMD